MGKTNDPWLDSHVETLAELVRMGLSCTEIALAMCISPGSVAGRIYRLRRETGDDTLRAGYVCERFSKSIGKPRRQKTPEEKAAATRARWELWESRNGGAVIQAIQAAERRAKMRRKEMRRQAMANLSDFPNAVHILDRLMHQCPWPLWGEDAPFSEKMMCGNPSETWGHYCSAHMCQAHDVRQRGTFTGNPNKWTAVHPWKQRAA